MKERSVRVGVRDQSGEIYKIKGPGKNTGVQSIL